VHPHSLRPEARVFSKRLGSLFVLTVFLASRFALSSSRCQALHSASIRGYIESAEQSRTAEQNKIDG